MLIINPILLKIYINLLEKIKLEITFYNLFKIDWFFIDKEKYWEEDKEDFTSKEWQDEFNQEDKTIEDEDKINKENEDKINAEKEQNKPYKNIYARIYYTMKYWFFWWIVGHPFKFSINTFFNIIKKYVNVFLNITFFNIKWILVSFTISFLYFFVSLFYLQLDFTKQIALWFIILIFFYLLMSTFNTFLNKYRYGKFTSSIQRFWKRTSIIFWLIEGFLFLLFFYYFLNSSQEPLYMHDYANLNQEFLIQFKTSYKNMILLAFCIYFSFILILNNNYLNYQQNIILLSIVSLLVFYMLYIETYQFSYIIILFSEKNWIFEEISQTWILEFEQNNLRVKQQYFILCLIAKYWHFIFIFISWFFFLVKCYEINKINYNLLGYNIQNLIILSILNLFCLVQWGKWIFKKFLESSYYWFHIQYDTKHFNIILEEVQNVIVSLFSIQFKISIYNDIQIISYLISQSNESSLWKYINW